tara:strand:+ start:1420 stop:2256 length:837 start_codon:yes stop_codon:yes gene_type:complete
METNRDDFSIAVRSAFLKKDVKQKFSLFALLILSLLLIFVETFNFKSINYTRAIIKDLIYRGAIVINLPNQFYNDASRFLSDHFQVYEQNQGLKSEVQKLNQELVEKEYLVSENKNLKEIIQTKVSEDYDLVTAKVILDKDSPFLKSAVITKGSNAGIKKGMPVLHGQNLIGRIVEVNFFSARILLLEDLNSRIPVVIVPNNYQSIMMGKSNDLPSLQFLPKDNKLISGEKIYTSGKDGVIHSGIPVGKVFIEGDEYKVKLFSDSTQVDFVNIIKSRY